MTQLPSNPHDGQQVVFPNDEGVCIYTYDAATNSWSYQQYGEVGSAHVTYTDQVLVRDNTQEDDRSRSDPSELKTQKEVNYFLNKTSLRAANIASTQADWTNQTYSTGSWILQDDPGDGKPEIQRFMLTDEAFADTNVFADVKYVSVHALGGGNFVYWGNEKPGCHMQIYGNPVEGDQTTFGIYEILSIQQHNMPDEIEDGADLTDAFVTYTVKLLAHFGELADQELCLIKTMPSVFPAEGGGGGGEIHVGENPPEEKEGAGWFDTTRLELFIFYIDGDGVGSWVPCSPLGARVEAGEALQRQLIGRVDALEERNPDDYLKRTGGTITGTLRLKRTDDASYWNYITAETPNAWHGNNQTHGVILNIGTTNSFKQQFKIQGRSGHDLFEIHDDGAAVATIQGNLNCTVQLKEGGKRVATQEYVAEQLASAGGGSFQTKYDGNRECIANALSTSVLSDGQVMFLNNQLVGITQPALVECIGLPLQDFDWDTCIKSGVIKANNGAHEAGYYQVFKIKEMAGRNMLVYVKPIWFDMDQALTEGGIPCYFQGVFFA